MGEEHDTQTAIFTGLHDIAVLWRNNTGQDRVTRVRYGLCVGSSDLVGVRRADGKFIALEVKSSTGRTTEEQRMFLRLVFGAGGIAGVVRSLGQARRVVMGCPYCGGRLQPWGEVLRCDVCRCEVEE